MEKINSINVENKKVIVRVDFNVPIKNKKIVDDTRIVSSLKTIKYLVDNNAKVILLSHLGRIESEEDKEKNSLEVVAKHLSILIKKPIYFCPVTRGDMLESEVNSLQNGEILLVQNTRYEDYPKKLESSCDENLSKYWASLGDIFVLDAFGSAHRCHASTYGISNYLPSYAGFLLSDEILMLENAIHEKKTLLLGGSKVEDKLGVIDNLVNTSDFVLLGGAMCFTFLQAKGYSMGSSIVSEDRVEYCKGILESYPDKIILPVDLVTQNGIKKVDELNLEDIGYDLGPETIAIFKDILRNSEFVMWNGPLGKYEDEKYEKSTKEIMMFLSSENIKTLIAGGDIISASNKFGVIFDYVSTGGGSTLEFLEGKRFKTIDNLNGGNVKS